MTLWLLPVWFSRFGKLGKNPFIYLDIPIGTNPMRIATWKQPIIGKNRERLSYWKSRHLSSGGRIVLINSVLSNLPIYFLSFFKAPNKVLKLINSI